MNSSDKPTNHSRDYIFLETTLLKALLIHSYSARKINWNDWLRSFKPTSSDWRTLYSSSYVAHIYNWIMKHNNKQGAWMPLCKWLTKQLKNFKKPEIHQAKGQQLNTELTRHTTNTARQPDRFHNLSDHHVAAERNNLLIICILLLLWLCFFLKFLNHIMYISGGW